MSRLVPGVIQFREQVSGRHRDLLDGVVHDRIHRGTTGLSEGRGGRSGATELRA